MQSHRWYCAFNIDDPLPTALRIKCYSSHVGVSVQPSVPNVAVSEGGDGGAGGGGEGGDPQAMVCIELASGNLQRNVSVRVMTISSPTSTGESDCLLAYGNKTYG